MNTRNFTKMIHEGDFVAEVDVALIYTEEGWASYLLLQDAYKLDDVREALRQGDVKAATQLSRVYTLTRIAG